LGPTRFPENRNIFLELRHHSVRVPELSQRYSPRVMKSSILLCVLFLIPQVPAKPAQSLKSIVDEATSEMRRNEPSWVFLGGICNTPPLLDEETGLACGIWKVGSRPDSPHVASVSLHQVRTAQAVSRWMKDRATRASPGWVVVPYDLGTSVNFGAYLATLPNPPSVQITFGKGRYIVAVNGTSRENVDRVARVLLRQIAD
jgi:hypothetical protein